MLNTLYLPMRSFILYLAIGVALTACVDSPAPPAPSPKKEIQLPITGKNKYDDRKGEKGKTTNFTQLKYHNKPVSLTKHAQCRMDCRHIDATEIQEMLDNGKVNTRKSGQSKDERTCPTQALEGVTHDGQTVRIIVADCDTKAKIVTVIDLKNEFKCDCK